MAEPQPYSRLAVLGAGAWGSALAMAALAAGRETLLWAREKQLVAALAAGGENPYLPGVSLPPSLGVTGDLALAGGAPVLLLAVPAQALAGLVRLVAPLTAPGAVLVICAKGIEKDSGRLLPELLALAAPQREAAILSGPSFARDVARGLPTAVTIAAHRPVAERLQASLGSATFRPYVSDDLVGVALGGAAKNVYAIACGVVEGMGLGENARAALLARSFAELARLGEALGARRETLMGLSGLGDLVLTATSKSSRNFSLGVAVGQGAAALNQDAAHRPLAEGIATAPALVARARREGVELPIAEAVSDLLAGRLPLTEAVARLMSRRLKAE